MRIRCSGYCWFTVSSPNSLIHSKNNQRAVPVMYQFSSVQSLDHLNHRGDIRDDSAEILLQTFLQEALMSSSGMGRDVHS